MRVIGFLTGTRAEYGILKPVMQACRDAGAEVRVIACAAHTLHGTVAGIEADGWIVSAIDSMTRTDTHVGRAQAFGVLATHLPSHLAIHKLDVLVVCGDREEALAGAVAANIMGIPVAHLHGGDKCIASDVDEILRPAISKLAHLHFTAMAEHSERLVNVFGEKVERVWTVGAPGLDRLRQTDAAPLSAVEAWLKTDLSGGYVFVMHHPSPRHLTPEECGKEMHEILRQLTGLNMPIVCSYPNTDEGGEAMRAVIDQMAAADPRIIPYQAPPSDEVFKALYANAKAVVGNSSSILIESGFLHVPAVLVGRRQEGRVRSVNVLGCPDIWYADLADALTSLLGSDTYMQVVRSTDSRYGDGHAASRVAEILTTIELTPELIAK